MPRYCIYLRKSRADIEAEAHGEGETLSRHKAALTELARKRGLAVGAIYEEIVSGETIAARPQMQRLLSEVGAGEWDGVLVMEIERLARGDTMDQGLVAQTFKYSGTKIITPIKTFDPANEFDEEYFEFGLFMARREFTTTNRRLARGREASAKEGKYIGSVAPYGYKKVKLDGQKGYSLEIIEEQAKVVRMIFDWYINGAEVDGERKQLGLHAIAARLNDLGIKSLANKDYWTIYGVRNMISNPVYIGKIRYGYRKVKKTVSPEGVKRKIREFAQDGDYIISDGLHEPIIEESVFRKAQEKITEKTTTPVKDRHSIVNPFSGLMFCGKCGHAITYLAPQGRWCSPRLACNTAGCKNVSSRFDLVEKRVLEGLEGWVGEYSIGKEEFAEQENFLAEIEKVLSDNEKVISELRAQLDNVYSFFERGTYSETVFKQRSSAIEQQISELTETIDKLKMEKRTIVDKERVQTEFVPAVKHLLKVYADLNASEKNTMLKSIIQRIVYEKDFSGQYHNIAPDCFSLGVLPRLPKQGD